MGSFCSDKRNALMNKVEDKQMDWDKPLNFKKKKLRNYQL